MTLSFQNRDTVLKKIYFLENFLFMIFILHVVLNSSNGSEYKKLKENLNGKKLYDLEKQNILKYRNSEIGVQSHLEMIMSSDAHCIGLDDMIALDLLGELKHYTILFAYSNLQINIKFLLFGHVKMRNIIILIGKIFPKLPMN